MVVIYTPPFIPTCRMGQGVILVSYEPRIPPAEPKTIKINGCSYEIVNCKTCPAFDG